MRYPIAPRAILRIALATALIWLSACVPVPQRPESEPAASQQARSAYELGMYEQAAELWQKQALEVSTTQSSRLRLQAADAWVLAGNPRAAEDLLDWINDDDLSGAEMAHLALVTGEVAVARGDYIRAQAQLARSRPGLPAWLERRYSELDDLVRGTLEGPGAEGLRESQRIAETMRQYDPESAIRLLKSLESVPSSTLARQAAASAAAPDRAGWMQLALVLRGNLVDGSGLQQAIRNWASQYPNHDVSFDDALDLWIRYRQTFGTPRHVAVLLPTSGTLRAAGAAVRDGIVSAYLNRSSGARISFYDTGSDPKMTIAAYFQAADQGADWIIGPLSRTSISALLNLAGLATPVLALNELPEPQELPGGQLSQAFGLSLSQEREAAAVARRMRENGLEKIILMAPDNSWGESITTAFQTEFLHKKGEILVSTRYLPEENDHSEMLERTLKIDESKTRKSELENRLGIELEFEPQRRQDVDGIFVAADPQQGRLIRPQLRFFDAGDIPTYATSRVYTGRPDPNRNQDIDGFNLPLTTWQFEHPTQDSLPELESLREGEFASLFAIGMDAWNLLPWIDLMRGDPDFEFSGQTGSISLRDGSSFHREPRWGYFARGLPVAARQSGAGQP